MRTFRISYWVITFSFIALVLFCVGCGTSQSNALDDSAVTVQIPWGARTRSRDLTPLSSAIACTVQLSSVAESGSSATNPTNLWVLLRSSNPSAYPQTWQSPARFQPGNWYLTVKFYADTALTVQTGWTAMPITLPMASNNPIQLGEILQAVDTVTVPAQTLNVGAIADLTFVAQSSNSTATNSVIPMTRGSANWTILSGQTVLSITPYGRATALSAGTAQVTATVDGITSAPATITVTSP